MLHLGLLNGQLGKYKDATNWIEDVSLPTTVAEMIVLSCAPEAMHGVDFVFSGLDSSVAFEIEGNFAKAGIPVISQCKEFSTTC